MTLEQLIADFVISMLALAVCKNCPILHLGRGENGRLHRHRLSATQTARHTHTHRVQMRRHTRGSNFNSRLIFRGRLREHLVGCQHPDNKAVGAEWQSVRFRPNTDFTWILPTVKYT